MKTDKNFYWQLFKSTFIVSMFTVGGASVTLDPMGAINRSATSANHRAKTFCLRGFCFD